MRKMSRYLSMILPGLYVGNVQDSKDLELLNLFQISHILSITAEPERVWTDRSYLCVTAMDDVNQDIMQFFPVCNDFIHETRLKYKNVLVHCVAGISRSVSVTIAYLMTIAELPWHAAWKVVVARRKGAAPNLGFQKQLLCFQTDYLRCEQRRLMERFCAQRLRLNDKAKCEEILKDYETDLIRSQHVGSFRFGLESSCGTDDTDVKRKFQTKRSSSPRSGCDDDADDDDAENSGSDSSAYDADSDTDNDNQHRNKTKSAVTKKKVSSKKKERVSATKPEQASRESAMRCLEHWKTFVRPRAPHLEHRRVRLTDHECYENVDLDGEVLMPFVRLYRAVMRRD